MDGFVERRISPGKAYTLEEALAGKRMPKAVRQSQSLLNVEHFGFDAKTREGQLVIHADLKSDVAKIFAELYKMQFPIEKIIPIVAYGWDDDASMADNNSSAFNYRKIAGTRTFSNHAFGRAIDINPMLNPHVSRTRIISPKGAVYDPQRPGTIVANGPVVKLFKRYGFKAGVDWKGPPLEPTDYQHFEKI